MNNTENRFYLSATDVKPSEYQKQKENAVYVLKTLINIAARIANTEKYRKEGFDSVKIKRTCIIDSWLPHLDTKDDVEIGKKLSKLVLELDKEENRKNPEFISKFKESGLWKAIVLLRNGSEQKDLYKKSWLTYKSYDKDKEKFALNSALDYYQDTPEIPVGLDIKALLDTVSIINGDKYIALDEVKTLLDATKEFITDLRKNPTFKKNYYNDYEKNYNYEEKEIL